MLPDLMSSAVWADRLVAGLLGMSWTLLGGAMLLTVTGAPGRLLGVGLLVIAGICLVAVLQSPKDPATAARDIGRRRTLRVMAVLLTVAFAALVMDRAAADGRLTEIPSVGIAYAALAAAGATMLYAALLFARGRAAALAIGLSVVAGGAALAASAPAAEVPAGCTVPTLHEQARIALQAEAEIDGRTVATASVAGERDGDDERWLGDQQGQAIVDGVHGYVRLEERAWLRRGDARWSETRPPTESLAAGATLDGRVAGVLGARSLAAAEDLGVERVDGRSVRRCRIAVDGSTARRAFLPLAWLTGSAPLGDGAALQVWRGELDWWTGAGNRLARAAVLVGGHPGDAWNEPGMRGLLRAQLSAVEPDNPPLIEEPVR
ncbi:MAG: hypothetical protein M3253_06500 [Chloroflexota bacterium]|nr:hypothetical protein [Chloroflexota bacterium]